MQDSRTVRLRRHRSGTHAPRRTWQGGQFACRALMSVGLLVLGVPSEGVRPGLVPPRTPSLRHPHRCRTGIHAHRPRAVHDHIHSCSLGVVTAIVFKE